MTPNVRPNIPNSTHHVSFAPADGSGTTYGLILTPNANAISRMPKVGSTHTPFTQKDWTGGRGLKFATDDRSRYADAKRLNTRRQGLITLGGLETFANGHRQAEHFMPSAADGVTWQALTGSSRFIAHKVTATASGNRARMYFWVRRRGTPNGGIVARLKDNSSGDPGSQLKVKTVTTSDIDDTVSMLYEFTPATVQAVTASTVYWVEISAASADDDATNHWEVGVDAARTVALTKASADGTTWADPTYDLYYRLVDDIDISGALFFMYKSQVYILTRPNGSSAPKLYMNGYRGIATGSGQSTTILKDTTQNWTTNALAGAVLLIIDGTNSEWQQPYRVILSNDSDEITTGAWGKAHVAASTTYVILGTNVLTEITGHGLTVLPTGLADAGDVFYFAQGDTVKMRRMTERNIGGTWTRTFAEEDNYAKLLLAYPDNTNRGTMLIKANDYDNSNRPSVAVAKAEAWGVRLKFPLLVDNCGSTTGWTASANVTLTADTSVFKTDSASLKFVVGGSAPELLAYRSIGPATLRNSKKFRLWVHSSETLEAGALKLRLSASATCATAITNGDLPFPMLNADEWTLVELPYKDNAVGTVVTMGILKTAHSGTVYIDGIEVMPAGSEVPLGNDLERINGLELYGDPAVPWVLRSGSIGWIANGTYNPVPLREYRQVEGIYNGSGHTVNDVYLYISFMQGLQEYYRANLDDIGPNKDEGMPEDRQGYITSMLTYPDRIFANIDAGADGYSSILSRKGGWHEEYRSDTPGKRIRTLFLQIIPGPAADRLWFCEGEDIGYILLPGNTVNELTDPTYRFTHEGVLETGWIGDEEQRLFSSVKIASENLSTARRIEWDYKTDEATTWTPISTAFTSGPVQEIALNKTGKRLKLRFRLQTNDDDQTPRITMLYVSTTSQPTPRYAYSMNFVYYDDGRDLLGNVENYDRAEELIAALDQWARDKTPLTMRSVSELFDNKTVFLDPLPVNPYANEWREQQEKNTGTLTAIEPS